MTSREGRRAERIFDKALLIFSNAGLSSNCYPAIFTLRVAGLRIRLISDRLCHDYAGMDYTEHIMHISRGKKRLLKVRCGEGFYFHVEKYSPGRWETRLLKSRC